MKCGCGKELTTGDMDNECWKCALRRSIELQQPILQGWICPKCGSVYGPHIQACYNCNKSDPLSCTEVLTI